MVIAALIVSVVALLVAGGSAAYTRIQGVETRKLRQIEAARRHEERAPELVGAVESMGGGSWYRLQLTLETPTPLTHLAVHIVEGDSVSFTPGTNGVEAIGLGPITSKPIDAVYNLPDPLTQGRTYNWSIEFGPEQSPSRLRLQVLSRGVDDDGKAVTWTTLVDIGTLPSRPRVSVI